MREQEPDEGACDKQRKVEPEVEWYLGVSDDLSNVMLLQLMVMHLFYQWLGHSQAISNLVGEFRK